MAAPVSDASIEELMAITGTRSLFDALSAQLKSQIDTDIQQDLRGKSLTSAQQRVVDNLKKKLTDFLVSQVSYEKMRPMILPIYRETFSEEEVAGMIAFYKTPAGQAVIHKMPTLMQKIMQMQHELSLRIIPKIKELKQEFDAEMKKASKAP